MSLQVKKLEDFILVGSAHSGWDLVQNMYGMYIRVTETSGEQESNMNIAIHADNWGWNRLRGTQLGYAPFEDAIGHWSLVKAQEDGVHTRWNRIRIKRDYKDVLTQLWRQHSPTISFDEFLDTDMGLPMVEEFEQAARSMDYAFEFRYEKLVESPQQVLTDVIYHCAPRWDSQLEKLIDINAIDHVIQESGIRELRAGPSGSNLEKVGVYAEWITPEQATRIDTFLGTL